MESIRDNITRTYNVCPEDIYVHKYKREGCMDDAVPKTKKALRGRSVSIQQSSATPQNKDIGRGLQKIVGYSHSYLAGPSCITSFGMVPSLHPSSFLMTLFFTRISAHAHQSTRSGREYIYGRPSREIAMDDVDSAS